MRWYLNKINGWQSWMLLFFLRCICWFVSLFPFQLLAVVVLSLCKQNAKLILNARFNYYLATLRLCMCVLGPYFCIASDALHRICKVCRRHQQQQQHCGCSFRSVVVSLHSFIVWQYINFFSSLSLPHIWLDSVRFSLALLIRLYSEQRSTCHFISKTLSVCVCILATWMFRFHFGSVRFICISQVYCRDGKVAAIDRLFFFILKWMVRQVFAFDGARGGI